MCKIYFNKVQVQFGMMLCYLSSTAFGASFFGIDLSAPEKVVNTGFGEISPGLQSNMEQYSKFPHTGNNQFPREDNTNKEENGYYFYPAPGRKIEEFKVQPQESPEVNNNQKSDSRIENKKDKPALNPKENNMNTGVDNDDDSTLGQPEDGVDSTTETPEYETTTDETLNRIGGAPPAVVASLLG